MIIYYKTIITNRRYTIKNREPIILLKMESSRNMRKSQLKQEQKHRVAHFEFCLSFSHTHMHINKQTKQTSKHTHLLKRPLSQNFIFNLHTNISRFLELRVMGTCCH